MQWINKVAAWFDRQAQAVQLGLIIVMGLLLVGMLWSFVFYQADFSGFGEWIKAVFGG